MAFRLQGGLKAVVWTDTLQQIIMIGTSIIVVGLGIIAVGGLDVMWQRSLDGDRIEFFKYVWHPLVRSVSTEHRGNLQKSHGSGRPLRSRLAPLCYSCISHPGPSAYINKPKELVTIERCCCQQLCERND